MAISGQRGSTVYCRGIECWIAMTATIATTTGQRFSGSQPRRHVMFGVGGETLGPADEVLDRFHGIGFLGHASIVCVTMEE